MLIGIPKEIKPNENRVSMVPAGVEALAGQGHTVVVVEHNTDLLETVDYTVELGPTGGQKGGHLLSQG